MANDMGEFLDTWVNKVEKGMKLSAEDKAKITAPVLVLKPLVKFCMIARQEAMKSIREDVLLVMQMLNMEIPIVRLSTCKTRLLTKLDIPQIRLILAIQMWALKESIMIF